MSKSIPDRWLDYKPYGDVINGTRILAFKVPLKEPVSKNLQVEQRFTTSILMKAFPKMKYIIDLTNTTRYYDKTDFTNAGVKYQKVMIPGMQVPSQEYVKRFFKAMEIFSQECGSDEIIGVHCTHGVNRSGYLICRYLVQQLGWKHADALKGFADARGYQIERTTYINDLRRAPVGSKIDVSKVNLDAPVKQTGKSRPNMKHLGHRPHFPPGPPVGIPHRRSFMNGGPFPPPPPGKFGPLRGPGFGPPRPPPPMAGPPPPPPRGPAMFGPPRPPPRGPYGPPPPPMPPAMRHGPPLPPPGPPGMRLPGPPRPPPVMGPPGGPPPRLPGGPSRVVPPRPGPLSGAPVPHAPRLPHAKVAPSKGRNSMTRAGVRAATAAASVAKQPKDLDFTSDDFEENLATRPAKSHRKRPFPKN